MSNYSHDIFNWIPPHLLEHYITMGGDFEDDADNTLLQYLNNSPYRDYNLTSKQLKVAAADYFDMPLHEMEKNYKHFTLRPDLSDYDWDALLPIDTDEHLLNRDTDFGRKFLRATAGQDPEGLIDWGEGLDDMNEWDKRDLSNYISVISDAVETGMMAEYALDDAVFNQAYTSDAIGSGAVEQPTVLDLVEKVKQQGIYNPTARDIGMDPNLVNEMGQLGSEFARDEYMDDVFTYDIQDHNEANTGGIMNFLKNLIR